MIKINEIHPIDPKNRNKYSKVEHLEKDYIQKFKVNTQPEILLNNAIINKKSREYKITKPIQLKILKYLCDEFDSIIIAKPRDQAKIISKFIRNNWQQEVYDIYKNAKGVDKQRTSKFGEEILHLLGYKERFRKNVGRGIWLANQLNIKSCPYCNANNTIITEKKYGKELLKFQLDHFFPKSEFPYLSISLYNLIPSCANCNITKSSKPLNLNEDYHPYEMNLASKAKFHLKYDPDPAKLTLYSICKQNLEIEFIAKHTDPLNIVKKHNEMYHIDGVYNRHQDHAEELLMLSIIYSRMQAKKHLEIKGLFENEEHYYRFLLRNYHLEKDTLKRPLAKFTQDIRKQLHIK
jgi:hypothetical protein